MNKVCAHCGRSFSRVFKESMQKYRRRITCSIDCHDARRAEHKSRVLSPDALMLAKWDKQARRNKPVGSPRWWR